MSDFEIRTASPAEAEDADAKEFWSTTSFQARAHSRRPPFYATEICRLIVGLGATSVLEFGCNAGRNLELLRRVAGELGQRAPAMAGVDINAESIAFGKTEWQLDLRTADESAVNDMQEDEWDLIFTISVLDHIPHPKPVLAALARAAKRWLVLVEPHHDRLGRVDRYQSPYVPGDGDVTPYSYVHDYDALLAELAWVEVLDIPFPTGLARLGPLYRLRLVASSQAVASTAPPEVTTESMLREAILGLAEERRLRVEDGRALRERIRELEKPEK